jgi:hypothetical protein
VGPRFLEVGPDHGSGRSVPKVGACEKRENGEGGRQETEDRIRETGGGGGNPVAGWPNSGGKTRVRLGVFDSEKTKITLLQGAGPIGMGNGSFEGAWSARKALTIRCLVWYRCHSSRLFGLFFRVIREWIWRNAVGCDRVCPHGVGAVVLFSTIFTRQRHFPINQFPASNIPRGGE